MGATNDISQLLDVWSRGAHSKWKGLAVAAFACPRMRAVVNVCQVLEIEVGVDLRSTDISMPQQFLHGPQVTAGLEQVAGK